MSWLQTRCTSSAQLHLALMASCVHAQLVGRCALSTSLGGCFGGVTGLLLHFVVVYIQTGHEEWDLHAAGNGALTGMVVRVLSLGCTWQACTQLTWLHACR